MDWIVVTSGLLALIIASISDLKTREVPDLLSYGFLIFAIGYGLLRGLAAASWMPVLQMLVGGLVLGAIGMLLYYSGQWGGADTKLVAGVGALLGLWLGHYDAALFLLLTILAGALYGLGFTIFLAIRDRNRFMGAMRRKLRTRRTMMLRRVVLTLCVLMLLALLLLPQQIVLPMLVIVVILYAFFYLWVFVETVEKETLIKEYTVDRLTEGDWIWKEVKVKGETICGPKDYGITREQIARLKTLGVTHVTVKEGIPFVPSFLVGFILLWIVLPLL